MSYLDEHALQTPHHDGGFENSRRQILCAAGMGAGMQSRRMHTGEIILLVGVIGAIAGATAAGYRRSRRIPNRPAQNQSAVRLISLRVAGVQPPISTSYCVEPSGAICRSPRSTCIASIRCSKSRGSTSSQSQVRR